MKKNLAMVSPGKKVKVVLVEGGLRCRQCLAELGILPGEVVRIIRSAPFAGPILAETNGTRFMVGRGMATKVIVEEIE